ncbi:mechanosensitive ion channel [Euhalothece natronophila Z-M001]|uniref:Mechanosensitive ion channel n=1 Tax=Euhalothece natronophila Z-M001 TaxID=522448 RepID=A0A5B8NQJ3_9CHRO|nr:mechanosensitive ion channel family protein [Euhalothece natronophila]QDZ41314.1 mechanosensitive ion channel [Euhalothece natronophila Z-M001]
MKRKHLILASLTAILVLFMPLRSSVQAQVPFIPDFGGNNPIILPQASDETISGCIRLDGRCVVEVAGNESDLPNRIREIQQRLDNITRYYFQQDSDEVTVRHEQIGAMSDIYVEVDELEIRLLTVTSQDANLRAMSIEQRAEHMTRRLEQGLVRAKQEREQSFLIAQGYRSAIALGILIIATFVLYWLERQSKEQKNSLHASFKSTSDAGISTQIYQNQQQQLAEIKHRGVQIARWGMWLGGLLYIVGLFPYTRFLQVLIINVFRIPFRLFIVGLVVYFLIRFSFILIQKFTSALTNNYLLTPEANLRLQLRISTISSVAKSIVIFVLVVAGILLGLSVSGINIGPLLAGAGLIGVAISLASQNLIRDAINGFLIILEDQYAVGDVVGIGEAVGVVEAINLRITQLRDTEGRLVTIPNSEINTVINYTSNWSQVDLRIPIAYHADMEKAIEIVKKTSNDLATDNDWRRDILEPPLFLGVDEFSNQGVIIRVWIKTKPLKQWPIAREYRRRIKIAFDQAGLDLALPHQKIWISSEEKASN